MYSCICVDAATAVAATVNFSVTVFKTLCSRAWVSSDDLMNLSNIIDRCLKLNLNFRIEIPCEKLID